MKRSVMIWCVLLTVGLVFSCGDKAATVSEPLGNDNDRRASIQSVFDSFADTFGFNGVALVAEKDQILFRTAIGVMSADNDEPLTPDSRLFIGSLTKQFTVAAVLRLVEQGKLSLDAPAGRYLTDLPSPAADLELRHLLAHTSGIAAMPIGEGATELVPGPLPRDEYMAYFVGKPLRFEPGAHFEYSNAGMFLLSALVEKVSGQAMSDFYHSDLFAPAKMAHTFLPESGTALKIRQATNDPHLAVGMRRGADGFLEPSDDDMVDMSVLLGAGSAVSTVDDLHQWSRALFGGKIVLPSSLSVMTDIGLGGHGAGMFGAELSNGMTAYLHTGGFLGFHALLAYVPKGKITVVLLSNVGNQYYGRIALDLAECALGLEADGEEVVSLDVETLSRFVGRYEGAYYDNMLNWEVRLDGGGLVLATKEDGPTIALQPIGEDFFWPVSLRAPIVFRRGDNRRIESLEMLVDGYLRAMKLERVSEEMT